MSERVCLRVASPEAMRRLGERLGGLLQPGDFVGLIGELGAGKTVLARGVAEGAGVPAGQVASPSFAIVYTYAGRFPLHHADFYRLSDEEELYATGFYDLLGGDAATLVEWLDRIPEAAPSEHLVLRIEGSGEDVRQIGLEPRGARHERLARALAEGFEEGPEAVTDRD
jgi:tRNA threonylcarbamoyladenosine biosynthesis protein TsaE